MNGLPAITLPPVVQGLLLWRDAIGQLATWADRHGDLFTICLPATGPVVVAGDPSAADQLLLSDPASSRAGAATARILPLLGPGCVLRQDGDAHLERRHLLSSAFHGDKLARHRSLVADIADREITTWPPGRPIALLPRMQDITFAVIAHLALGITDSRQVAQLHHLVRRLTGPSALAGTWLSPAGDGPARSWMWRRVRDHQAPIDRLLSEVAGRRRSGTPPYGHDVLGLLLQHEQDSGQQLAPAEVNEELLALLMVGHETTAAALGWAVERLAREPAVTARLAGSLRDGDTTYLTAFIHELLRWRPRLWTQSGSSASRWTSPAPACPPAP